MSAFVGALLVLTAASQVSGSACRVTHNNTVQCFAALGESVFLHLANDTNGTEIRVKEKKNNRIILKYMKNKLNLYEYVNRSEYFTNGTFRLDRALKNDSGTYAVEMHNTEGALVLVREIQLNIQAPVSHPVLSQLCLPHGEVRVSCSSDGDVSDYHWTLGHKPLEENDRVILRKNVSGDLTCTARNDISRESTTVQLYTCIPAPVTCTLPNGTVVTVAVNTTEVGITTLYVVGTVFTFLALTAAMCCFQRNRTRITGNNETQELVYAEVTGVCVVKRGREIESKPEVVYGQIKVP
ncbi:hypothetical protein AAFF_G00149330 [Aldrovandia affinis]|uniref:Ig-like domain-containing protein n=1 Tax=Aldrovandia affinis TaxID=143900 RepID=A0AAD7W8Z8_9TELE|nr:hypothetical protein AAFF_G00149330 [Aldrovandia affinis]